MTLTYPFEGQIHHRDSLGTDLAIEPGAVSQVSHFTYVAPELASST